MSQPDKPADSPVSRFRPKPAVRIGNGGNGIGLTAQQQMHADFDMVSLRLSRAIPVGLAIPMELRAATPEMESAFERSDVESFRKGLHEYQMAMWRWFEKTPEGIEFKKHGAKR